jgi:tRNA A-37 threonylcarbamoyl transferase component Bud32
VPQKLGRFEIRSRLGAGGFGAVYRAYDPVLEREVALKVPRAAVLETPEARARFLREPKAAARLQHPHIVPVFDAGTDGEHYYIASAFIAGQTLQSLIATDRSDLRQAARIVREIAEALHYAHGKGIVHRDVKPANIMIDGQGQALLMDFGIAHVEESEERLTHDGSIIGTPTYMAPEQADRSFGDVGPHSDQYALGVVLYELLCGETPFGGPPSIVIHNLVNQDPTPPHKHDAAVPRDLETICLKAIAKRPADRYADCGAMAEDLRRFLGDETILARRLGWVERLGRWYRRNTALAIAGSLVLLLIIVAGVISIGYWTQSSARRRVLLAKNAIEERYRQSEVLRQRALRDLEQMRAELAESEAELQTAEARVNNARTEAEKAVARDAYAEAQVKLAEAKARIVESRDAAVPSGKQAVDPSADRRVAEQILQIGGSLSIVPAAAQSPVAASTMFQVGLDRKVELPLAGEESWVSKAEDLPTMPFHIVRLRLARTTVQDVDLERLQPLPYLIHLELDVTSVTDTGLRAISQIPSLRVLQLPQTRITNQGLSYLTQLRNLMCLNVSNNGLSDAGVRHLSPLADLVELYLDDNPQITDAMFEARAITWKRIGWLSLEETAVTDAALSHIATMPDLDSLMLSGTSITGTGLVHLKKLHKLNHLLLARTRVTDETLVVLRELSFGTLDLADTQITDRTLSYLAGRPAMHSLNLNNTQVTDAGLRQIEAIPLLFIFVNSTRVTDAGILRLGNSKSLVLLAANDTQLTNAGLEAVGRIASLRELQIRHTKVTPDAVAKLKQRRPELNISWE